MVNKKFLQQVYRKIVEEGISNAKLREGCIDILEDDAVIFKVDNKKSMFYSSDKRISSIVDNLHEKNTAYCL